MNARKTSLILSLIISISMLLASCATPAATPAPVQPTTAAAPVQPTTAPAAAAPVTITYMRQSDNPNVELDYVKEFEAKNPDIKVNVDSVNSNDTYNKLVLETNAGNPPDVFMTFWTADAVSNKLIAPLDDLVDKNDFNTRFTTAGKSYATYQGHIYAIPWRAGASVFLINCKMFQDAGIDIPKLGWTWADLTNIAKKLTDPSKGQYGFGWVASSTDFATEWQFWPFVLQAGGQIYQNNRAAYNSPAGVKAMNYLISLKPYIPAGNTSMDINQMLDLFVSNKLAMFEDGPWYIGVIQQAHPDFKICVAPMVVGDQPGNIAGGTALGISPLSQHKDAAWKFIQYMTSDDVLTRWNVATNNIPPNVAAFNDPAFKSGPLAAAALAVSQPNVIPANQYPESTKLNTLIRSYLQAAYLGQTDPKTALDQAATQWNNVLMKYDTK